MRCRSPLVTLVLATLVACSSTKSSKGGKPPAGPETDAFEPRAPGFDEPGVAEAAYAPDPQDQGGVQEQVDEVELRRQKRAELSRSYVEQGKAELERAELAGALTSFANALELDPTNQEARDSLRHLQGLMGDEYQAVATVLDDETERAVVRRAQAFLEADLHASRGDAALAAGQYDTAIEHYRKAQIILAYHPYIASDSLDERVVTGKIETAVRLRDEARAEADRTAREEAQRKQAVAEADERGRRENKLRQYYQLANQAFLNEKYREAERWTAMILVEDPGNEAAKELQATARNARHFRADERNRRDYREQWLRTFDELDTMNVPQTEALVFSDLKRWAEVVEREPLEVTSLTSIDLEDRQAVLDRLEAVAFAPSFGGPDGDGSPLEEVAAFLQRITGVNFWISPKVLNELDPEETAIRLELPDRTVRKVLDMITETKENLFWKVEDGVVKFVTGDEMTGNQVLRNYSVQDLIHPIPDYPGRDINVSPSGGIVEPDEDLVEREANVVNTSLLEELIQNNIAPETWDADPNNSIRVTENGTLVVNQTLEVHEQIQKLLEDLREATGIMVDIQARFMKVEDNFLEDIGVDFRGLGTPGPGVSGGDFNDFGDPTEFERIAAGDAIGTDNSLGAFYDDGEDGDMRARVEELYDASLGDDDVIQASGGLSFQWVYLNDMELELILRAVSKSERVELVTAPRIVVHNTARANLSVLNQVAYVQDFDVEIAQAASIADPIIDVIQDGVILDVRPVVSADRRFITLELRPTIAELQRPIEEKVTTLGSQNSVTIQLPEVEIQRVRTSIPMPDGGTVLLGGMKISDKRDKRSGVPILNKVPLLSALFERKGSYVSNRKLLILLRASIVIPEEYEPSPSMLRRKGQD